MGEDKRGEARVCTHCLARLKTLLHLADAPLNDSLLGIFSPGNSSAVLFHGRPQVGCAHLKPWKGRRYDGHQYVRRRGGVVAEGAGANKSAPKRPLTGIRISQQSLTLNQRSTRQLLAQESLLPFLYFSNRRAYLCCRIHPPALAPG